MTVCAVLPFDRLGRACVSARLGDHDKQRAPRAPILRSTRERRQQQPDFWCPFVAGLVNRRLAAGKKGGRTVPLNKELRAALVALKATRNGVEPGDRIIHSERDIGMSPGAVQVWFHRLYESLGFVGASSHSGRRTFVTRCAKNIIAAGGSLRDVQELAGHASLATTQR
jgi:integrase